MMHDGTMAYFIPLLLRQIHNISMDEEMDRPLKQHAERSSVVLLLKCEFQQKADGICV